MRVKLIAIVVAGLFAQNAYADENWVWSGSAEVGGRGTNIDGANRNGGVGGSTASTTPALPVPYKGPVDGAKAQEYQDIDSAAIGVIDIRGSNRILICARSARNSAGTTSSSTSPAAALACGRGRSTTTTSRTTTRSMRSRRYGGTDGTLLQGPGLPYPQSSNPANWSYFNYSTQRNTWGGNLEFSNKSPWFIRADYNEVKTNGVKPGSGQLGTGSGNGLIEFGAPVDYKTQNTTIEGGYNSKQYGIKLAYLDSKFTDDNNLLQWTNFYMRSGQDYSLLPPDNELKKWSLNGYIKQLPWDSAIIARYTQSKLTNNFGIAGTSLKPATTTLSNFIPASVGNLLTQPYDASSNQNLTTFDGDHKTTTFNAAWNASPMAQLDLRVYYDYYDLENNSTNVSYRQGSQGTNCATPPVNSATCYQIGALVDPETFQYTKNSAGFDATWAFNRYNKLARRLRLA